MKTIILFLLSFILLCPVSAPAIKKEKKDKTTANIITPADSLPDLSANVPPEANDTTTFVRQTEPHKLTAKDTISDTDIVVPEGLDSAADSLIVEEEPGLQPPSDRNGENIDYSDSIYIERLSRLPTVIELPFNRVVKEYIVLYTQKRRELVEKLLALNRYYEPIFEEEIDKTGMPLELKYMPIIESALRPNAVSRVGATGLWQFMIGTAKNLGLEVNSVVDERRDP